MAFSTASYLKDLGPDLRVLDSASAGVTRLARWPIESADPDSLRSWGFVRQPPSPARATTAEEERGPVYYGPDARVLGLPRWVPKGKAGGFVELRRLPAGAWVPRAWELRAPQAIRSAGSSRLRLRGWLATGGRVIAVGTPDGAPDPAATAELLRAVDSP